MPPQQQYEYYDLVFSNEMTFDLIPTGCGLGPGAAAPKVHALLQGVYL